MFVHRTCSQGWKDISRQKLLAEVLHVGLAKILDEYLACARCISLLDHRLNVVALAHIADHCNNAVIVVFFEPRNNDGGI